MVQAIVGSNPTLSASGEDTEMGPPIFSSAGLGVMPFLQLRVVRRLALSLSVCAGGLSACTSDVLPSEIITATPELIAITLVDDGQSEEFNLQPVTVGRALSLAQRKVYVGDRVDPPLDTLIRSGMTIEVVRARSVLIHLDGREIPFSTHRKQVAGVLADAGVTLTGRDFTDPELSEPVTDEIRVIRVEENYRIDYEPIPFDKQWQGVPDLEIDQMRMVQPGQNGLMARRVQVRLQDGIPGESILMDEWVQNPPNSRVVGYGMSTPIRIIDTPYGPLEYWRAIPMSATSYSPSRAGTPLTAPWFGLTRSGKVLKKGMVAIDPRLIPLGTQLYVPGYGLATAEDTGSGIRGRMIDLGYEDHDFRWWRSYLTVYVRPPVPPADQITWMLP